MDRLTPEALRARVRAAIGEPELTGQGFDLAAARARRRHWWALGLGTASAPVRAASMVALAVTVAVVLTVGTVIHLQGLPKPAGPSNGPAGLTQPHSTTGPAVDGFVPEDVTAVSAGEWWVLGSDSAGCTGAACTRILHTQDAGQTFTSIPAPPAVVTGLRFVDSEDGWAFGGTTVWSTHDGGAAWHGTTLPGLLTELDTSGSYVYAVVDIPDPGGAWTLDRSPITEDSWEVSANFAGEQPVNLDVHGNDVWLSLSSGTGLNRVWVSTDDAAHFTETPICPGALGVVGLDAATPQDLWAACTTGSSADIWRSIDGGQSFSEVMSVGAPFPSWDGVAATSGSTAVVAGARLQLTVDGGQSFRTVLANGDDWIVVGFTTSDDGFAFGYPNGSYGQPNGLWRTDDAGAQWHAVQFP